MYPFKVVYHVENSLMGVHEILHFGDLLNFVNIFQFLPQYVKKLCMGP
jgi:hypothetical protein